MKKQSRIKTKFYRMVDYINTDKSFRDFLESVKPEHLFVFLPYDVFLNFKKTSETASLYNSIYYKKTKGEEAWAAFYQEVSSTILYSNSILNADTEFNYRFDEINSHRFKLSDIYFKKVTLDKFRETLFKTSEESHTPDKLNGTEENNVTKVAKGNQGKHWAEGRVKILQAILEIVNDELSNSESEIFHVRKGKKVINAEKLAGYIDEFRHRWEFLKDTPNGTAVRTIKDLILESLKSSTD